ncbi:7f7a0d29-a8fb-4c4e-a63c-6fb4ae5e3291 [Thermothielavioides terrestris]|nr:7f7a0d29-a8fb-4c4e-a63c-6fb4ae5e3291 [Thermothielavioides terrestris]
MASETDPDEHEVREHDPMPKGYKFVPKGNVYITKHCRKKTHEADKTLYVVVDGKNKPIGLRCPAYIYNAVMSENRATAAQRAEAVQKRDAAILESFEEAILKLFPRIPKAELPQILKHSLKKHSRRVGRANAVALQDRVKLAVRAHIRHMHTDYDMLLKQGTSRSVAREKVWDRLNEVARAWGGRPLKQAATLAPVKEGRTKKNK